MRKLFILPLVVPLVAFGQAQEINVAKLSYGVVASESIVDQSPDTHVETTKSASVILPLSTKVNRVTLSFKPNRGRIVLKTKSGDGETILKEVVLEGTEEGISVELSDVELSNVIFEWIPDEEGSPLTIKEAGVYTKDESDISAYAGISQIVEAGAEAQAQETAPKPVEPLPEVTPPQTSRPIST